MKLLLLTPDEVMAVAEQRAVTCRRTACEWGRGALRTLWGWPLQRR
jgi:hypothetical protein